MNQARSQTEMSLQFTSMLDFNLLIQIVSMVILTCNVMMEKPQMFQTRNEEVGILPPLSGSSPNLFPHQQKKSYQCY